MINQTVLKNYMTKYKRDFDRITEVSEKGKTWWEAEKYKWKAVKTFQDNWDEEADDFPGMLVRALNDTSTLLVASSFFPRAMILGYAKAAPEEVRAMFAHLYDEKYDLIERIEYFKEKAEDLHKRFGGEAKNHYQNENVISIYLWLYDPEKYYIYKLSVLKRIAAELDPAIPFRSIPQKKPTTSEILRANLEAATKLYDEINSVVKGDAELHSLIHSRVDDSCYLDTNDRILTLDIGYYIYQLNKSKADEESETKGYGTYPIEILPEADIVPSNPFISGYHNDRFAYNRILFGAPGTGKSYALEAERKELLGESGDSQYERVTFHPDYSYASFVGTYKPVPCAEGITYQYVPGPFMRVYANALDSIQKGEAKPYLLIIEEINRANAAAVFGDLFQLLDRNEKGVSDYPIQATEDMKKFLCQTLGGNPEDYTKICLPDNMLIWATMNSADQGVFPLDTAFKRRWDFTYMGLDEGEEELNGIRVSIANGSQDIEWNQLRKAINAFLAHENVNEDKLLGAFFIQPSDVKTRFSEVFRNKVIMYLYEDAARQKRSRLFEGCGENLRYSDICRAFDQRGIEIFNRQIVAEVNPDKSAG